MTASAMIALDVSADTLADALERLPDFRVLRRVQPMRPVGRPIDASRLRVGLALDLETTGLDHRTDRVIELAMQRFHVDEDGRIVDVDRCWQWFEDPGTPIEPHITRLTRITDDDVRGRTINEGEATSILLDVDFIVAHNSQFDRAFTERRLPIAAGRPWVCSMADVDWRARGFEGRSLSHLLLQMGLFYEAHRADGDVLALLHLLDHRPIGGIGVLSEALTTAARPTWIVEAVDAGFAAKDALKRRGYRWNPTKRFWWTEVADAEIDEEVDWAEREVYSGEATPRRRRIDWTKRYGATVH